MKGSLFLLLSVLFIAQSLPVKDHKSHGDLRRSKRHSVDRHSIADREVRTIISAIVDAILDGDRKKRSDIPEDEENTVEEDDDGEEENFQDDSKENKESENSESGNSQIEEHSSILEENVDKKIFNNTNSVSRSVINTLNTELLKEGKMNSNIDRESDSELNSDFEIESGSADDSGHESGSTQDEPEWELFSVSSKSLINKKLDAGRMKRDEEGQIMKAKNNANHLKVKDKDVLDNNVSRVNTERNKIIIMGSSTESGFSSGDDSDFESGIKSNVLIQGNLAKIVRKSSSENEIEQRHTIHKNDNENAVNKVYQSLKLVNIAESGSGHSSGEESGLYGKSLKLSSSNESTINKRSAISVEEGFNDQITRIHHAAITNSLIVQKKRILSKETLNHPKKDKETIEQSGAEFESGSGSMWDGSSGYGLGSGGEKREKVYLKAVGEVESDEVASKSIAAENASGSGSGSGSAFGSPKSRSEENIRSTFSEISQIFQVNGNKTKSSDGNILNNTNIFKIQNVPGNNSEKLIQNLNYKSKTINNEALKNKTFTNQTITRIKDMEEDQDAVLSNKKINESNSTSKDVSNNSYQNDATNEDIISSAGSGDKNDENSDNKVFRQTFNQTRSSTKEKNNDKKETLLKVVADMAKAADESIQADDSDSVVKKSKIVFPERKSQKKISLMQNKFENDLKEKNILSVDHALKSLVLTILKEDPSLKSSLKMLTHKRKVEEKKLQDQILRLVIHEQFKKQKEEAVEKKVTNEIKDFEGLVETLSQTESLTPDQHEIISRKLERDLLNHLSIPKKHGPKLLKQEFELLKSSEMEFVKQKIEDARENAIKYVTKRKGKMEDIRKFAIAALKPIIESLPLKKEDIEGLAKSISKSAWLNMITHTKSLETKAERKRSYIEPLEF